MLEELYIYIHIPPPKKKHTFHVISFTNQKGDSSSNSLLKPFTWTVNKRETSGDDIIRMPIMFTCAMVKVVAFFWGWDGKNPTFNDGILISCVYKPLRTWVDEFIPYYGNNGSLDPGTHIWANYYNYLTRIKGILRRFPY